MPLKTEPLKTEPLTDAVKPNAPAPSKSPGQRVADLMGGGSGGSDDDVDSVDEPIDQTPVEPDTSPESSGSDLPFQSHEGEFGEGLDDVDTAGGGGQPDEPSNPWLDQIRGLGFEGIETEEQARERLIQAYEQQTQRERQIQEQMQQIAPLVRYGQEYLQIQNDPRFKQVFSPQERLETPEEPQSWWNPPKYDPALIERYQEDRVDQETGQVYKVWKENTPAQVRADAEAYDQYIRDWQHKLVYDPREAIGQAIQQEFDRFYKEREQERQQQTSTETALQRFQQDNAELLFARDPVTNRLTNQLSREGKMIQHYVQQAEAGGMTNPELIFDYALLKYQSEFGQTQPARTNGTNGNGQPNGHTNGNGRTPDQRNLDHLKRGAGMKRGIGGIPNSGGSTQPVDVTDPPPAPNQNLSIGQRFLQQLKADDVI